MRLSNVEAVTSLKRPAELRVGAFQFAGSGDIVRNLEAVERGVDAASTAGVRLLALQECALSGYPPVEVGSVGSIDFEQLRRAESELVRLARDNSMYIAYGTIEVDDRGARNVVRMARPSGVRSPAYVKRGLYGWDAENFVPGESAGPVHLIDGFRIGIRICWEVRFPEYFRELRATRVDIAVVPFCMLGTEGPRRSVAEAHLVSRAVENYFHVIAANSCSESQTAPTCIISSHGHVLERARWDTENLVTAMLCKEPLTFGQQGIAKFSDRLAR